MPEYSEQDLQYAAQFRAEIHREALALARQQYPEIDTVVDRHGAEDYFQKHWDYPGKWYTIVAIPYGYRSRAALVKALAEQSVGAYLQQRDNAPGDPFYSLIARYPDSVVDYCIAAFDEPYRGCESHWNALMKGALHIIGDDSEVSFHPGTIKAERISPEELFAPADRNGVLNYRTAFLYPPHGNHYTDKDFDKINAALFPNGTDCLEPFQWSTEWSDYFDDGHEWWGALCLTVYDRKADRFVIIMASATD